MDGSRFDAWTRRRLGLAAGGLTAGLLGLTGLTETEAKKRKNKKKKKCQKLGVGCNPTGKKKCCKDLSCEEAPSVGGNRCCKNDQITCTVGSECCSTLCQSNACFCKAIGQACSANQQCCNDNCSLGLCAVPVI